MPPADLKAQISKLDAAGISWEERIDKDVPGGVSVSEGRQRLAIHIPWYALGPLAVE